MVDSGNIQGNIEHSFIEKATASAGRGSGVCFVEGVTHGADYAGQVIKSLTCEVGSGQRWTRRRRCNGR